jgi:Fe-S-cluster-containing dehydrogenase component
MARYGMIIDLNRCVRCRTCYVACKREHNILAHPRDEEHPYEYYRLRYVEWEQGKFPGVRRAFVPVHCMHCEDPICLKFCPVDAITRRNDGIVIIDKERCNGCGACAAVCPYGALYIDPDGKADGCDFCADRLTAGLAPTCVEMCPAGARIFGDLDNPQSEVFGLINSGEAKPLLVAGVKNTRVYYIPSANELDWDKLSINGDFLAALDKRKRDLPPIKGIL